MEKQAKLTANQNFLRTIFVGQSRGHSVIEICERLSSGDKFKGLKLIAKFKTLLVNNKSDVLKVINDLNSQGIVIENPYESNEKLNKIDGEKTNNILTLEPPPSITEAELNSLFLGLCKLVKRLAMEEVSSQALKREREAEIKLKRQIENLQMLNEGLAMENKRLLEKLSFTTLQKG